MDIGGFEGQKKSGPHSPRLINISSAERWTVLRALVRFPIPPHKFDTNLVPISSARPHPDLEMLWDDFADTPFGYWTPQKGEYGLDGYPFDPTSGEAPSSTILNQPDVFDVENISTAEIEAWWLASQPDGGLDRHTESSLVNHCDGQHGDVPEQAGSSIPDPSVVPLYPAGPCPHPPGTPSIPTLSWSGKCLS